MKVGLKLVHSGPGATPELMRQWTQFAEVMGFNLIMAADHVALTSEVLRQYPSPYYEPFTSLAWLAAQSKKLELGTTVIVVPYGNPIALSEKACPRPVQDHGAQPQSVSHHQLSAWGDRSILSHAVRPSLGHRQDGTQH